MVYKTLYNLEDHNLMVGFMYDDPLTQQSKPKEETKYLMVLLY